MKFEAAYRRSEPPSDWFPVNVLLPTTRPGVAVVKKAPSPMAPPIAVPTTTNAAVLELALPPSPPCPGRSSACCL